jgi:hypothetical protein
LFLFFMNNYISPKLMSCVFKILLLTKENIHETIKKMTWG